MIKNRKILGIFVAMLIFGNMITPGTGLAAKENKNKLETENINTNSNYISNRDPLINTPFLALPIGSIRAKGWLYNQLELQKNGLTGHMEDIWPEVNSNSGWLGGTGENWEKGPYYVRGLVSLAYVLNDNELKQKAQKWIDWSINSQREDGYFGPSNNDDWWPRMPMLQAIQDYYEATGDKRVIPFMTKYFQYQLKNLPIRPLKDWGKSRAGDNIESVYWLYNITGDKKLLDLAKLLHDQGDDWTNAYTNANWNIGMCWHVVNLSQGLKFPPLYYQQSKNVLDRDAFYKGIENINRQFGRIDTLPNADEGYRDLNSTHGTELCGIVERMLSDEIALRILGNASIGDQLEKVAFNSLPGALTPDIKGYDYFLLQNQVAAITGYHGFINDHGDSSAYGAPSGYQCCLTNFHMGWPKFVQNMWMATNDNGLAIAAYGPSEVTAKVGDGKDVNIVEDTNYPFDESIIFTIKTGNKVTFPLKLRIPQWCNNAEIKVNGQELKDIKANEYYSINREWTNGDVVQVRFPMHITISNWQNNSMGIERGPLIYSIKIGEDWRVYNNTDTRENKIPPSPNFPTQEVYAKTPWNYGLIVDRNNPDNSFEVIKKDLPYQPFSSEGAPIILKAKGKRIPSWTMDGNVAGKLPQSPVVSNEDEEDVTLIPFGCGKLRISQIPQIGENKLTIVREAETAKVIGALIKTSDTASNDKYVGKMDQSNIGSISFENITVPKATSYSLKIRYANGDSKPGYNNLFINGNKIKVINYPSSGSWGKFSNNNTITIDNIPLNPSFYNDITLSKNAGEDSNVEIDNIEVIPNGALIMPMINSIVANDNGSVTLNTNMNNVIGTFKILYGKQKDQYNKTAYNFNRPDMFSNGSITISGLDPGTTYHFVVSASIGGKDYTTDDVAVTTKNEDAGGKNPDPDFSDDFESSNDNKWTPYGDTNKIYIQNGKYVFGKSTDVKSVAGETYWKDYVVESDISVDDGTSNNAGIMFRVTKPNAGPDNYYGYYFGVGTHGPNMRGLVVGYANGSWNPIKEIPMDFKSGEIYRLKVIVYGPNIGLFCNGQLKYVFQDGTYTHGQIGLRSYDESFKADNIIVRKVQKSDIDSLGTLPPPPPIIKPQISASRSFEAITVKYPKVSGADSYKIEYGIESGNYTSEIYGMNFNPYSAAITFDKFTIGSLKNNQTYYLRLVPISNGVDLTASDEIVLSGNESNVNTISINPTYITLTPGQSQTVTATVYDRNNNPIQGLNINWTSDNSDVATVDNTGKITGVSAGTTTVKATYGDLSASVNVTVKGETNNTEATLEGQNSIKIGNTYTLTYGLKNAKDISAQVITLQYDPNIFDYVKADSISDGTTITATYDSQPGTITFVLATTDKGKAINGNKEVLNITLKAKTLAQGTKITLTKGEISNTEGNIMDLKPIEKTINVVAEIDKTYLEKAIKEAKDFYAAIKEGINNGQYPEGTKSQLEEAIKEAQSVYDNKNVDQTTIDKATDALNNTVKEIKGWVITDTTGIVKEGETEISIGDLGIVATYFAATSNSEDWNKIKNADINHNNKIDLYDITFIAKRIIMNMFKK